MKMRALVMCAVLSGGVCGVMRAADWPAFGGPTHDGVAAEVGINKDWTARPPKTLWTVNLGDDGHAGMSVAEGKVFIVDHAEGKDVVRALDVATGREVWSFGYVDAKKNRYGYSVATPLVENGRVYTISRLNKVHCLNAATGEMYWSRDLLKDFAGARTEWDYAASPVMVEGKLIVFPGGKNAAVAALDVTNGQTLWQGAGDSRPGYATPVIAKLNGRTQIVAFLAEGMLGIDPATGERLWTFPWVVDHQQNSATPLVRGNTIFYSTAWG